MGEKAIENIANHDVSFDEAITVFDDPLALTAPDDTHSEEEFRWATIGHTTGHRLVVVFYTERGDTIRLISARSPTRQERRAYEEEPI
jgi:uncharacterized DUF497 family protein